MQGINKEFRAQIQEETEIDAAVTRLEVDRLYYMIVTVLA